MYRMNSSMIFLAVFLALPSVQAQSNSRMVWAKVGVSSTWKAYPTRLLQDLPANVANKHDSGLSVYGGMLACKVNATGYFYSTNRDGRWWLVDPEGCLFLDKGVSAVTVLHGADSNSTLKREFGDKTNWAEQTTSFLRTNGFNNLGAWSDTTILRQTAHPLVYTRVLNFMSDYGQERGGTYQQPGHTGYPNNCIFVFDPQFVTFCDLHARQLANMKNDPWLLGYFSDNEMPLWRGALTNYLQLPADDPGHLAALKWFQNRHGQNATIHDVTFEDETDFLAYVVARYYKIVSAAIKKHDPNHLYLGSRFNGRVLSEPEVFKAAGPYLDVVSVNYYDVWTPSQEKMDSWEQAAGKPILITEWYTKAEDSGLPNAHGAGWIVKSQNDRGMFYQNFTLALLQSKVCVGWDWFKYSDNDPTDTNADPSNRDANKGIVNIHYEPYLPLLTAMKQINERAYSLVAYFDYSSEHYSAKDSASRDSVNLNEN